MDQDNNTQQPGVETQDNQKTTIEQSVQQAPNKIVKGNKFTSKKATIAYVVILLFLVSGGAYLFMGGNSDTDNNSTTVNTSRNQSLDADSLTIDNIEDLDSAQKVLEDSVEGTESSKSDLNNYKSE